MRGKLKTCKTDFSQNRKMWSCVKCIKMFKAVEVNPSFVIGSFDSSSGFCHGHKPCIFGFCFRKPANSNLQLKRVPYNKILTNLACSSPVLGNIGPRSFL